MPRLPAALVVSEAASIDQLTGRVTAFNILDFVFAQGLPALVQRITAIAAYELTEEEGTVFEHAELLDPNGKALAATNPVRISFPARTPGRPPASHTSVHTWWNTPVHEEGDYSVVLSQSDSPSGPWIPVARRRIVVARVPHPLAPPPPAGVE